MGMWQKAILVATFFLLASCNSMRDSAGLERRLADAETSLAKAQHDLAVVQTQLEELKKKNMWQEFVSDLDKVAYLTPTDEGYSRVRFDLGVLTVRLVDIKPYANGAKVTIQFGNPLSSSINGLKTTLEWGKVSNKGIVESDSKKSKEVTFSETLGGGSWTTVSVVLDGVPPTELGFVQLSKISHTGIALTR